MDYCKEDFINECENSASEYVDNVYMVPEWTKKIRKEYADMVYEVCKDNMNEETGAFNADSAVMDLSRRKTDFFKKHPHVDGYLCPEAWRDKVFSRACEGFKAEADSLLQKRSVLGEEDFTDDDVVVPERRPAPRPAVPADATIDQCVHDVSSRLWGAWRTMSDLAQNHVLEKFRSGEVDQKTFNATLKVRDSIRKLAGELDDLCIAFQTPAKEDDED